MAWPFNVLRSSKLRRIPRLVHMTARYPIDPQIAANVARLRRGNPSYLICCYDDEQMSAYVKREWGGDMWSVFDSISPEYIVARADLWRYLMIYDKGGVYLDDKSGPRGALDRVIRDADELILSTWNMNCHLWADTHGHKDGEFLQWCIIARPRHPLIGAVIREVVQRVITATSDQRGKSGVITITGPLAFTEAILGAMKSGTAGYRIMKDSFGGKMFFNAITKNVQLTKHHHGMRPSEKNYRTLTTPVIKAEAARSFHAKFFASGPRDFAMGLLREFDTRHPYSLEGDAL